MKKFKYVQVYETCYATYVEAESLEEAKKLVESGNYDRDFEEDDGPCMSQQIIYDLDEDGDVIDQITWNC